MLRSSLEVNQSLHSLDNSEFFQRFDFLHDAFYVRSMRRFDERVIDAVIEQNGAPNSDALAEALEVALGCGILVIAVDEYEVDFTGFDLVSARIADDDFRLQP